MGQPTGGARSAAPRRSLHHVVVEDVIQGIVKRPKVRVDLRLKVPRQEAKLLPRLNRWTAKKDFADAKKKKDDAKLTKSADATAAAPVPLAE